MTDQTEKVTAPEQQEIATIQKDITYPAFANVLRNQDETLQTRGSSKGLKLYDEIERDCTAYGDLQKRKLAVISRPWQVDPASEAPLDMQAANIVRAQLASEALNFDNVCLNLLDAILKGYAVAEVMWKYVPSPQSSPASGRGGNGKKQSLIFDGAQIVVDEIKARDQRRFGFDDQYLLRLKTFQNLLPGETVPERKFIVHSFGAKDGNPYGLGLGTRLFWPVFFKRQGISFWLTFADKFGSPTAVGKYPAGTSIADQGTLLNALSAIAQDAGVTIPEGMAIELLEATRGGSIDTYEKLCRYMDEQITFTVLGESPVSKGGGGQAASAAITRNEVRLELVQADSDLLSATLNRTLVKWISEYNVPGAMPPRVWRKVEEQKDLGAVATRDLNICGMGFKPTLAYIIETYGGEWEVAAPPAAKGLADNPGGPGGLQANFSEVPAQLIGKLGGESSDPWAAVVKHVQDLVDHAESMEELQASLLQAYDGLPLEDLRKIMAQGFQVAALAGMVDVIAK